MEEKLIDAAGNGRVEEVPLTSPPLSLSLSPLSPFFLFFSISLSLSLYISPFTPFVSICIDRTIYLFPFPLLSPRSSRIGQVIDPKKRQCKFNG